MMTANRASFERGTDEQTTTRKDSQGNTARASHPWLAMDHVVALLHWRTHERREVFRYPLLQRRFANVQTETDTIQRLEAESTHKAYGMA